ncbi:MAG: transcriptional activator NhaR [Gammaproteobacteria bacterium]|nr:transcriptional activator NhaR [Gammaproteobacteria bacterium]
MRHLNYNHLLYFWIVAREGSIARASEVLHLTPQTISGQLKLLEENVGEALFDRVGRGLVLTDTGRVVNQYADEIFTLGAELTQRVRSKEPGNTTVFHVGITNSIPKLIAYRVLNPVLSIGNPIRIVCREADMDGLLADLAVHRLDLVLSDRPIPAGLSVKAYNHALGDSAVAFFAQRRLARKYLRRFPESLEDAPLLMPADGTALRNSLDDWFDSLGMTPHIVAEFDDSALLKAFGEAGTGLFPAPAAISGEIEQMYGARQVGIADGVTESFFAISPERRLKHPAVIEITERARSRLFRR